MCVVKQIQSNRYQMMEKGGRNPADDLPILSMNPQKARGNCHYITMLCTMPSVV